MQADNQQLEYATVAGGCFWCIQGPFDAEAGVKHVEVGYAGGTEETAHYMAVASRQTDHREAVQMQFDPAEISYRTILEIFFRQIDPTDPGGQFADRGPEYTTAVYYHSEGQKAEIEAYIAELNASGKYDSPIVTSVEPYTTFFRAEEEHQDYAKKNPLRYKMYKKGSGRAAYLKQQKESDV